MLERSNKMIKIYTTPSCSSCRKAKKWFDDHNIPYEEKNLFIFPITRKDIELMLKNADNGFEDIISTRSKVIKDRGIDVDNLKFSEILDLIIENPSILKRPIIVDDKKMQVGYNDEEIRVFIPREKRSSACDTCAKRFTDCDYQKKIKEYALQIKDEMYNECQEQNK